jgi:ribosomal protein S18 acetylase RimI-like enzyme
MDFLIRPGDDNDLEALVNLSLLAWEPVFDSFQQIMGSAIYTIIYPEWRTMQQEVVEGFCRAHEDRVLLVAEVDERAVGFLVYDLNHTDKTGEVQLLAVHPEYQNLGIGTRLNDIALSEMKESGMKLAAVSTGGDLSHAPARRCYEKAGYIAVPAVRYYKDL